MIFKWLHVLRDGTALARRRSDSCMAGSMDARATLSSLLCTKIFTEFVITT